MESNFAKTIGKKLIKEFQEVYEGKRPLVDEDGNEFYATFDKFLPLFEEKECCDV